MVKESNFIAEYEKLWRGDGIRTFHSYEGLSYFTPSTKIQALNEKICKAIGVKEGHVIYYKVDDKPIHRGFCVAALTLVLDYGWLPTVELQNRINSDLNKVTGILEFVDPPVGNTFSPTKKYGRVNVRLTPREEDPGYHLTLMIADSQPLLTCI